MDNYDKHEREFMEALKGHKRQVQLLLPFDKRIEEMNEAMARATEKRKEEEKKKKVH